MYLWQEFFHKIIRCFGLVDQFTAILVVSFFLAADITTAKEPCGKHICKVNC